MGSAHYNLESPCFLNFLWGVCVCVYMCMHVHVCMYACVCVYVYRLCVVCVHVCACVFCVRARVCVCVH